MKNINIAFNKPHKTGKELTYISEAHNIGHLAGDGIFTKNCSLWLEKNIGVKKALLTHSCTAALEMAAILIDANVGDEIIMPSYTFVSTANAFFLRGAKPVFVDIRPDTLNIDENLIEAAITHKTKAIVVVHYAGVPCEMNKIMEIARKYSLFVIEDSAQGILSKYQDRPLGSIGHIGCLSFHETKNIISGEGGALLINDENLIDRAEIIREKGTNRTAFNLGLVDKYRWVDFGSSFLPGEITAAFLWAQMESAQKIIEKRVSIWDKYDHFFSNIKKTYDIKTPHIPDNCIHNGHIFYIVFKKQALRDNFIRKMKSFGVNCVFHYVPLHSSPMGKKVARTVGNMMHTENISETLVRMPLWIDLEPHMDYVLNSVTRSLETGYK